ncbi:MAG: Trep_Strep domain-containing protein [Negativicutes bacterium]|nr:Trep_Strep domain-containing protein [Negativicutes bacterium]
MEKSNKINTKDLINIGIYFAVYLVVVFVTGMLNMIPFLYPLLMFVWPILGGIPFMLFLTKVQKPGMLFIMAVLLGAFMFISGYTWVPLISSAISGLIAEFILRAGKYKKFKFMALSYSVFSLWALGCVLPMWVLADSYMAGVRENMGNQYTDALMTYMPSWMAFAGAVLLMAGGLVGALLGRKMLNKHFKKAGIV